MLVFHRSGRDVIDPDWPPAPTWNLANVIATLPRISTRGTENGEPFGAECCGGAGARGG
jgi:hypothetical protein